MWRGLLQFICDLALKKQWLRQECGWLAFSSISYIRAANLEPEFALTIIEALKSNNLVRTPEGVAVWLEVKSCYPDAALPENVWKHRDPLCKDEATSLAEVMRDASGKQQPSCDDSTASQGAGTWSQQLHFAWDVVLRELYSAIDGEGKGSSKRIKFLKFWTDVVDSKQSCSYILLKREADCMQKASFCLAAVQSASTGASYFLPKFNPLPQ